MTEQPEHDEPYMGGISPEGYARIASEKTRRSLLCMLRDARKKLVHHGRHSWMGKQAKIEIAAAEAELTSRNMPIPAEGQETIQWEKPKE